MSCDGCPDWSLSIIQIKFSCQVHNLARLVLPQNGIHMEIVTLVIQLVLILIGQML